MLLVANGENYIPLAPIIFNQEFGHHYPEPQSLHQATPCRHADHR
jgi:hypothetical protein